MRLGLARRCGTWAQACLVAAAAALLLPAGAAAHETLPASLRLDEVAPHVFSVVWRLPATQGLAPDMQPVMPDGCQQQGGRLDGSVPGAQVWRWQMVCPQGLLGYALRIAGQENYLIDTVIRVGLANGTVLSRVTRPREPTVWLTPAPGNTADAQGFFALGVAHILGGIDHLLFVFCLLLWVKGFWPLLRTITGFTVGHSLTLSLASLGLVQLPGPPIEACIALSILFLAAAVARDLRHATATAPGARPWLVAMAFGLLHGFGFAAALKEVGLPGDGLVMALLTFNVGVEAGQLLFVAAVLGVLQALRYLDHNLYPHGQRCRSPRAWERLTVYGAGSLSAFWLLQRLAGVAGMAAA